mmetsp:Transcript_101558/g.293903  ORF Transcript_101558/g.293903 Transcript_101558/m.293903 type:complete len:404 (+) Transcript_101558:2711-3922(+)
MVPERQERHLPQRIVARRLVPRNDGGVVGGDRGAPRPRRQPGVGELLEGVDGGSLAVRHVGASGDVRQQRQRLHPSAGRGPRREDRRNRRPFWGSNQVLILGHLLVRRPHHGQIFKGHAVDLLPIQVRGHLDLQSEAEGRPELDVVTGLQHRREGHGEVVRRDVGAAVPLIGLLYREHRSLRDLKALHVRVIERVTLGRERRGRGLAEKGLEDPVAGVPLLGVLDVGVVQRDPHLVAVARVHPRVLVQQRDLRDVFPVPLPPALEGVRMEWHTAQPAIALLLQHDVAVAALDVLARPRHDDLEERRGDDADHGQHRLAPPHRRLEGRGDVERHADGGAQRQVLVRPGEQDRIEQGEGKRGHLESLDTPRRFWPERQRPRVSAPGGVLWIPLDPEPEHVQPLGH